MKHRFGPAGNSDSFYARGYKSSLDAPGWLASRGLTAYEYQCSRGVNIKEDTARQLGLLAREYDIALSIHAPYYINLATTDPEIRKKTRKHLLESLRAAVWMNAGVVVFHPGAGKEDRKAALERAKILLGEIMKEAHEEGLDGVLFAPETMGKPGQLGNLEEVLELCTIAPGIIPALDFGHLHAASLGKYVSVREFEAVFDRMEDKLGKGALERLHIHFSPIEFTTGGEKRHRSVAEGAFGPDFTLLAEKLAGMDTSFTVICESSGTQAEDALIFKEIYEEMISDF